MTPSCRNYRRALLLGDLVDEVARHANDCGSCARFRDRELGTQNVVRQHRPSWRASPELRSRVSSALAAARREDVAHRFGGWRLLGAAAVVAATVVIIAIAAPWQRDGHETAGQREAHATTDFVVNDHLRYARGRSTHTELRSRSVAEIQAYFERQLSLAVRVPRLAGARLTGARRCSVRGRPAALVFYERTGDGHAEPLSLFVFEKAGEDFSAMDEIEGMPGKRSCHRASRGVGIVVWEERGLIYVLAGALDTDELGALLGP